MNTPNNAAALECVLDEMGAFIEQEESPNLDTLENWHQRLRATLTQPDAITSQPSGEAVAWISEAQLASLHAWPQMSRTLRQARLRAAKCGDSTIPLYPHPSADASGEAMPSVSDSMVRRFRHAYENMPICATEDDHVRAALTAALEGRT